MPKATVRQRGYIVLSPERGTPVDRAGHGGEGAPSGGLAPLQHGIRSYADLRVWQEAMDLAAAVYTLARTLPREERFGLAAQMRKAAVSVPSNIAEGWGRGIPREFAQFLRYSRGSLKELETQWRLAVRIGYSSAETTRDLEARSERLGRMLYRLIRALEAPRPTKSP